MGKIIKTSICSNTFNDSWRRLLGYLQGKIESLAKGRTCKTEEQSTQANVNAQIDALLTKNHG